MLRWIPITQYEFTPQSKGTSLGDWRIKSTRDASDGGVNFRLTRTEYGPRTGVGGASNDDQKTVGRLYKPAKKVFEKVLVTRALVSYFCLSVTP